MLAAKVVFQSGTGLVYGVRVLWTPPSFPVGSFVLCPFPSRSEELFLALTFGESADIRL